VPKSQKIALEKESACVSGKKSMSITEEQFKKFSAQQLLDHILNPNIDDDTFDESIEEFLFVYSPEQGGHFVCHTLMHQLGHTYNQTRHNLPDLICCN
jgi:hypothetical protein